MEEKLLNMKQVSEILGIKQKTLYQWKWQNTNLPFVKVGKSLRVSQEDLLRFIQKNKTNS